jgi:hypothetical protein
MNEAQAHIKKAGAKFKYALAWARYAVRQDRRLVGLDKIRAAIAHEAALRATGYPPRPFLLPRNAGRGNEEIQLIAEQALEHAVKLARENCEGLVA